MPSMTVRPVWPSGAEALPRQDLGPLVEDDGHGGDHREDQVLAAIGRHADLASLGGSAGCASTTRHTARKAMRLFGALADRQVAAAGAPPAARALGAGRLRSTRISVSPAASSSLELDLRHHTQLEQVGQVPLPVWALGGARRDLHPRLQRLVAGGAERLERAQDRLRAAGGSRRSSAGWGSSAPCPEGRARRAPARARRTARRWCAPSSSATSCAVKQRMGAIQVRQGARPSRTAAVCTLRRARRVGAPRSRARP